LPGGDYIRGRFHFGSPAESIFYQHLFSHPMNWIILFLAPPRELKPTYAHVWPTVGFGLNLFDLEIDIFNQLIRPVLPITRC